MKEWSLEKHSVFVLSLLWSIRKVISSTARKQAEEAIKRSESKYRKLLESMKDGFVFISMDGMIKEFNEPYRQMIGYTLEELLKLTGHGRRDACPTRSKIHDPTSTIFCR